MSTGCSIKTDPLVYFDDNFGKYGPILTIFFTVTTRHLRHTKIKLFQPHHLYYVATLPSETLMLVSMQIFQDHAAKQISMYSNG